MKAIPKEVMEKIEEKRKSYYAMLPDNLYAIAHDTGFGRGAEFGYRLLCEGKDAFIEKLKQDIIDQYETEHQLKQQCEGKEKEIAELKERANKDSDSLAAIAIEYNKRLSEISSLEAEKAALEFKIKKYIDPLNQL